MKDDNELFYREYDPNSHDETQRQIERFKKGATLKGAADCIIIQGWSPVEQTSKAIIAHGNVTLMRIERGNSAEVWEVPTNGKTTIIPPKDSPKWTDVRMMLPAVGVYVLVSCDDGVRVAALCEDGLWKERDNKTTVTYVGHWMPCPTPPKKD